MKIAHISDLHFTSAMQWPPAPSEKNLPWAVAYMELERDLKEQKPDLLLVTGDLANNDIQELRDQGLKTAWLAARKFLESVCGSLRLDPRERLFVIPGNHDVKILGNITREQLLDITGSRLYRWARGGIRTILGRLSKAHNLPQIAKELSFLDDPNIREVLRGLQTDRDAFIAAFSPYEASRFIPKLDLYVVCIDSNPPTDPLTNFAQGAVSAAEAVRVHEIFEKWKQDPEFDRRYKIALLHHHPMPVLLTEGIGGLLEEDRFHLMRNAGNFLRLCLDNGIDFVLHGHKHAHGYATVSLPRSGDGERPRSIVVVGAGSVYVPFSGNCTYNILTRQRDHSWLVDVRTRQVREEGISTYASNGGKVPLVSPAEYRWREWNQAKPKISIDRMDILAVIDDTGDVGLSISAKGVRPVEDEELSEYKIAFSTDSRLATIEDASFKDIDPSPNQLEGVIALPQPATRNNPRDVDYSFTVVGMTTFSAEYCKAHKGLSKEHFTFGVVRDLKRYESVNVEIEFPLEFPPLRPRVEVVKRTPESDPAITTQKLLDSGMAAMDQAETAYCRSRLRTWAQNRRLSFHIDRPLPDRDYVILWELPIDEFEIITDGKLRAATRAAVKKFKDVASMKDASAERQHVHAFLRSVAEKAIEMSEGSCPSFRVDLSIHTQGPLTVVASLAHENGHWVSASSNLTYALGETLRGRAYLERRVVSYAPGEVENKRSPVHHDAEAGTQYQIAVPLLWPPEPLYFPRVGVVTLSCNELHAPMFEAMLHEGPAVRLFDAAHGLLGTLAAALKCPFPEYD